MPVTHATLLACTLTAAAVLAATAAGATPTKAECIAASETGQDLEHAGKLREARSKLALCVAAACPGVLREDCAQKLGGVTTRIPSVVFAAKDGAGNDLTEVRVAVDGAPLVDRLDGTAVELDPGEHRFTFESGGLPVVTRSFVVREGEKGRHELVVLKAPGKAPVSRETAGEAPVEHADAPSSPPDSTGDGQRTIGLVLGGAGLVGVGAGVVLGLLTKSTYDHAIQTECSGSPNGCSAQGAQDGSTAHSQATMSTVAFVAGGLALGAGAVLYVTAPKRGVSVGANVGPGAAQLQVGGSW
jgi:hypothetical protein